MPQWLRTQTSTPCSRRYVPTSSARTPTTERAQMTGRLHVGNSKRGWAISRRRDNGWKTNSRRRIASLMKSLQAHAARVAADDAVRQQLESEVGDLRRGLSAHAAMRSAWDTERVKFESDFAACMALAHGSDCGEGGSRESIRSRAVRSEASRRQSCRRGRRLGSRPSATRGGACRAHGDARCRRRRAGRASGQCRYPPGRPAPGGDEPHI